MQWDKWKCIRNLGWEWEMKPGGQRSARIGCHSDSELPGGHCNNHFKFTMSRRQNPRLLRLLHQAGGLFTTNATWEALNDLGYLCLK